MSLRTLLTLKRLDIAGQAAVTLGLLLLLGGFSDNGNEKFKLAHVFYAIGSWQVLSFVLHLFSGHPHWLSKMRRSYTVALVILMVFGILAFAGEGFFGMFLILAGIGGIVLGIGYLMISASEWTSIRNAFDAADNS